MKVAGYLYLALPRQQVMVNKMIEAVLSARNFQKKSLNAGLKQKIEKSQ